MPDQPLEPSTLLKLSSLILGVIVFGVWLMVGSSPHTPDTVWHYRMTVTVETPEGLKTGSAVREVIYGGHTSGGGGPGLSLKLRGEAVAVDLGKRGTLFAMASGGADLLLTAFNEKGDFTLRPSRVPMNGKVIITSEVYGYPLFVRFRDLNDPKTIENVQPLDKAESVRKEHPRRPVVSYEDAFGTGVSLKEVSVEMTSEPVTRGVEKYLPWVLTIGGGNLGGGSFSGPEWYEQLDREYFKSEGR